MTKKPGWQQPPQIKIYEALGALGDGRLKKEEGEWRCYSSSGNKFYTVEYDEEKNIIYSNDNGSYWVGYLGYPAIAYLMKIGKIKYSQKFAKALQNIKWKDVNVKFKNDFGKTEKYCQKLLVKRGYNLTEFLQEVENIEKQIKNLKLKKPARKKKPPTGY